MKVSKLIDELKKMPRDMSVMCYMSAVNFTDVGGPISQVETRYDRYHRKNVVSLFCHYNKPFFYNVGSAVHVSPIGNALGVVISRSRRHYQSLNGYMVEYRLNGKKRKAWFQEHELAPSQIIHRDPIASIKKAIKEQRRRNGEIYAP